MRIKWMKRRGERGAAVVEFGIVTMILVPLVMFSMYFTDLAKARLKTAEIARPSFQVMSTSTPPRARSPLTLPVAQAPGSAGSSRISPA